MIGVLALVEHPAPRPVEADDAPVAPLRAPPERGTPALRTPGVASAGADRSSQSLADELRGRGTAATSRPEGSRAHTCLRPGSLAQP